MRNVKQLYNNIADRLAPILPPISKSFTDGSSLELHFRRSTEGSKFCIADVLHSKEGTADLTPVFEIGDQTGSYAVFSRAMVTNPAGQNLIFNDIKNSLENGRPPMAHRYAP